MSWQPHGPSQSERSQSSSFAVKSGDGQGSKSNQKFPLYIVNIPLDINEEKLSEIFNEAGNVIHSKCLPPREGRNSCVGFITYSTEEEAEKAISLFNNVQMNNLTLKVDYTKSFKEGRTQKQDYAKSPFSSGNQTHGSQNSTRYSSNIQQNSSSQYPQELQSSNIHSIGRGIHHAYDSGNQLSSIGRGIHPESQQSVVNGFMAGNVGEGSSQPGMQPHSMNPEVPETTGMQGDSGLGQYNYQSNMDQDMQSSYYNGTQIPQSSMPNNLFIGGSDYHDAPQNTSTSSHEQSPYGGDVWEPPQGNSSFGGYNYQANSQSEMQSYSIDPQYQQPHSVQGDQLAVGSQVEMNGVVNGFGNMQLTSPAEPSASQSFGSNLHQVSSRLPRAQIGSGSVEKTCHNCGEAGHFSRECPNRFGGGGGQGGGCHRCGEQGHFARECPNSSGGVRGGNCHQCGQPGHFSRECPNNSGGGGQGGGCHRCGEQGHFARECPNSSGGDRGGNCHQCGQPGHFSRECPNNSGGGGQGGGCHRCGEHGHFARECPNNAQEGSCPRPPQKVDYVPPPIPDDVDLLFKAAVHKGINFDRFDNIPVEVTGNNPPPPINTFDELLLPDTLKSNLGRAEFTKPTPVQKHGIPIILNGRDIMACAQTGSGKTVAFLLPVMAGMVNSRLPEASYLGGDAPSPAALCVAPTRELAYQIYTEALKFSSGTYLRPVVCYGGVSVQHQLYNLERGCHILIGTPGRLIDFVGRNKVSFTNVRYLILDEADRMLDMGFENDVRKIVNQFGMPEKTQRQTLMFSATFPDEIQKLARDFLNDYLFLAVGSVGGSNLDIKQEVIDLQGDQKRSTLMAILGQSGTDKTLVFVERKRNADFLASWLSQNQYPATSISGDRTQKEREDALRDFRNGRAPVLIATSVAARGLDIPDVKHVINYDLPQQIEEYVHRIGRTGRIGNQGKATAFFERGKDDKLARSLVKVLSDALQDVPSWIEEVAERALGTSYGPSGGKFASRDTRQFGRGGSTGSESNSRTTPSTNISFANQPPPQLSNNVQNGDDEEEWD